MKDITACMLFVVFSVLFIIGCDDSAEIGIMKNYLPSEGYTIERVDNFSSPYLDTQVPKIVFKVGAKEACLQWGKIITRGRPEIDFVFVDRWSEEKIKDLQEMQQEVDKASDDHLKCVRECQNTSCTPEAMQNYTRELVKQQPTVSEENVPPCLKLCREQCKAMEPKPNDRVWPHSRSQYYPDYFTPGYSLYVFSRLSDARDYYGPVNGTQCTEYDEENRVLLALCEKNLLYRLEGNRTNLVTYCEPFENNPQ